MTKKKFNQVSRKDCEHELILNDEHWVSQICVMVQAECQKCKTKFRGSLFEDEN